MKKRKRAATSQPQEPDTLTAGTEPTGETIEISGKYSITLRRGLSSQKAATAQSPATEKTVNLDEAG